jgi:tRNA_anti-like
MKLKRSYKFILVVILLTGLAGIIAAIYFYNLSHKDMLKSKADFVLSAEDLQKEFESDEVAATSKFVNKIVEVKGIVSTVESGENNALSVSLKTGNDLSSVICTLPGVADASVFKQGETVTIRGECSGFLMDVLLNNCVLIGK